MPEQVERGAVVPIQEAEGKQTEYTPEFFQQLLTTKFESFNGDLRNASELMSGFMKGVLWVYEQQHQQGDVREKPELHIVDTDDKNVMDVYYQNHGHKIVIRKDFLEKYSKYQIDGDVHLKRDRETVHKGNIQQWFQLLGVEEADHSIFIPEHGHKENNPNKSLAEYHANSTEFHALGTRIKYAEAHQFPDKTLDVLRGLQRAAKNLRGRQQMYTETQKAA